MRKGQAVTVLKDFWKMEALETLGVPLNTWSFARPIAQILYPEGKTPRRLKPVLYTHTGLNFLLYNKSLVATQLLVICRTVSSRTRAGVGSNMVLAWGFLCLYM